MSERVVVLGGAGFLGSHLCSRLHDEGAEVVCVDNLSTGSAENVGHLRGAARFAFVEADVTDGLDIAGDVDTVLHFASPASPLDYARLPVETLRVGSVGTFHALELSKTKGARFLLASTSEVYGDPLVHPQPESYWGNVNPVGPRACYDESKRFAEAAASVYADQVGVDVGIVRIFNTFGPRMRPNDGRAIPTFVHQALHGEPLTVAGDGSQTRSVCFVDDLVEGVLKAARSTVRGPVNLGNPYEISMLDLARWIRRLAGSDSEIVHSPLPRDDPRVRRPRTDLARELLGWEARTPVEEGLRRTIAWYRERMEGGRTGDAALHTASRK